ncbi:unnamed protein product [Ilex paraguariensis]|uniref:RING-type domain-containing protein n=1 Tax=Ilex paraguariensis TaxID=185542 RepID=A0ABC8R9U3_9AQUA
MTTLDREEHAGIGSEEKNSSKRTVMENLEKEFAEIAVEEEFPDEFQCCVCLDLLYKPVVLGCGHLSCFWCVFKAMDSWQESHCPVCREPYNHFPSICRLMHILLVKLYPIAYKRRKRQVLEGSKKGAYISRITFSLETMVEEGRASILTLCSSVTLSSNSGELHERLRHTACQSLPKRFDFNELEHILK